eukprot:768478-Hanusia_phi.AAC.5
MEPAVLNLLRTSEVALIVSSLAGLVHPILECAHYSDQQALMCCQELESKILCLETILLMTSEEAKAIVQAPALAPACLSADLPSGVRLLQLAVRETPQCVAVQLSIKNGKYADTGLKGWNRNDIYM